MEENKRPSKEDMDKTLQVHKDTLWKRKVGLERWDEQDQKYFKMAFGRMDEAS